MNEFIEKGEKVRWINEDQFNKIDVQYPSEKINLKWRNVIWKTLTDKKFRWLLKESILYAMRWQNSIRGSSSCDVMLFESNYFNNILEFKKEEK
jgi:hypothetical protein